MQNPLPTCTFNHKLEKYFLTDQGSACNVCLKRLALLNSAYGCRKCDYSLCIECYNQQNHNNQQTQQTFANNGVNSNAYLGDNNLSIIDPGIDYGDVEEQMQYLKSLELARKLQNEDNDDAHIPGQLEPGSIYNGFSEEKEYRKKQQIKVLPPRRRNQPVKGNKDDIMILYHVTNAESGRLIKESNKMIRGQQGMFGGGIYFAETAQDANYKAEHRGALVTCRVYVGKCLKVKDANAGKFTFTSLYKKGYDSVWAPNGAGNGKPERVVFNWDQVVVISVDKYDANGVMNQWQKSQNY